MERKYWVPALERANLILNKIANGHGKLKLIELSKETGINKSSIYSLLRTMESLEWVTKDRSEAYALGRAMVFYNQSFLRSDNLVERFLESSPSVVENIGESVQLSMLDGNEIVYLAKKEGPSLVRLISEPGMRFPAYATAMGKMMLSALSEDNVKELLADAPLNSLTPNTITDLDRLLEELDGIRKNGFAIDHEEVIQGFICVAAPIRNPSGHTIAAISTSMLKHVWELKKDMAVSEILRLAEQL
ncbi:MAG: IclR family transcriptional regulator [Gorillibacterium sp.]|nr:IclR family transcriptional regulator [Gorillibacterium sp.]